MKEKDKALFYECEVEADERQNKEVASLVERSKKAESRTVETESRRRIRRDVKWGWWA